MIFSGIWSGGLGAGGLVEFCWGICEGKDGHGGDERGNISNNSDMASIDDEE